MPNDESRVLLEGTVRSGKYQGWRIRVEGTDPSDVGFLILASNPNAAEGYDTWVERFADIPLYLAHNGLDVEWIDDALLRSLH